MKLGKKAKSYKEKDREFQTFIIDKVENNGRGKDITIRFNTFYRIDVQHSRGFTPKTGMTLKIYGQGAGHQARGIEIDKHIYKYLTPKQYEAEKTEQEERHKKQALKKYKKNLRKIQRAYRSFPTVFKARIDRLIQQSPSDRHIWEPYEIFITSEAIKIIKALKTVEEIEDCYKSHKLFEFIPTLDKNHDDRSLVSSVKLAYKYLNGETI